LHDLNAPPQDYSARIGWSGVNSTEVRVRARGRASASAVKPGLRVDFAFNGRKSPVTKVDGLVLLNLVQDPSYLRDWLAMQLFRKAGVPAPRRSYARVFVNSQYAGLYTIGEMVDQRFLKKHFREDGGHLYQLHEGAPAAADAKNHKKAKKLAQRQAAILTAVSTGAVEAVGGSKNAPVSLAHAAALAAVENFIADVGFEGNYYYSARRPAAAYVIPWGKHTAFNGDRRASLEQGRGLAAFVAQQTQGRRAYQAVWDELMAKTGVNGKLATKVLEQASRLRPSVLAEPGRDAAAFDSAVETLVRRLR
jgi:spore coat protein CotH